MPKFLGKHVHDPNPNQECFVPKHNQTIITVLSNFSKLYSFLVEYNIVGDFFCFVVCK